MADQESRTLQATIEQVLDLLRAAKKTAEAVIPSSMGAPAGFSAGGGQGRCGADRHRLWPDEWLGSWRLRCYQSVCPDEKGRVLVQGGLFVPAGPAAGILCVNAAGSFPAGGGDSVCGSVFVENAKNSRAAGDAAVTSSAKAAPAKKKGRQKR